MNTMVKWLIFTVGGVVTIFTIGFLMIADSFDLFSNFIDFLQQFPLLYDFAILGLILGIFLLIAVGVGIYLLYKRYKRGY